MTLTTSCVPFEAVKLAATAGSAWMSWQAKKATEVRSAECAWYRPPVLTDDDISGLSRRAKEDLVANGRMYEQVCKP